MKRNEGEGTIDSLLLRDFIKETNRCRSIIKRIDVGIDLTLFLVERGLAFRGDEEVLGSQHNGIFLGFIEVLAKYDPVLEEHLERMRNSQGANQKRMQAHYLSNRSQNNFIKCSGIECEK